MTIRYRKRIAGSTEPWSEPISKRNVIQAIARRQRKHGPPYRWRRRDRTWGKWWRRPLAFRIRVRRGLRLGPRGNYQVQFDGGKVTLGVLKFKLPPPVLTRGQKVIEAARSELGTPYRFGEANGPEDPGADAFDCSGLTQWAWATVGVTLPHSSEAQRTAPNVGNFSSQGSCEPGDLIFFHFPNSRGIPPGRASHVGLWLSPGKTIDTRSQSSPVAVRDIELSNVIGFGRPIEGQQR